MTETQFDPKTDLYISPAGRAGSKTTRTTGRRLTGAKNIVANQKTQDPVWNLMELFRQVRFEYAREVGRKR